MSDIETAVVDSLKVLDPKRPIREEDVNYGIAGCREVARTLLHRSKRRARGYD